MRIFATTFSKSSISWQILQFNFPNQIIIQFCDRLSQFCRGDIRLN